MYIIIETGKHSSVEYVDVCQNVEQVYGKFQQLLVGLGIYSLGTGMLTMSQLRTDVADWLLADDKLEYEHSRGGRICIWLK
jgi:hypothetical protein